MCCYNNLTAVRDLQEEYPDVLTAYKIIRHMRDGVFCGAWQRHYVYHAGSNPAFDDFGLKLSPLIAKHYEVVAYGMHVYTSKDRAEEVLNHFRSTDTTDDHILTLISVTCDMKHLIAAEHDRAVFSEITISQEEMDKAGADIEEVYNVSLYR